jgi:hypothetical protein
MIDDSLRSFDLWRDPFDGPSFVRWPQITSLPVSESLMVATTAGNGWAWLRTRVAVGSNW